MKNSTKKKTYVVHLDDITLPVNEEGYVIAVTATDYDHIRDA